MTLCSLLIKPTGKSRARQEKRLPKATQLALSSHKKTGGMISLCPWVGQSSSTPAASLLAFWSPGGGGVGFLSASVQLEDERSSQHPL